MTTRSKERAAGAGGVNGRAGGGADGAVRDLALARIQDLVLWTAVRMVHHANSERPNPDGIKIGGHQASCASSVTILTSLVFDLLGPRDRLAVKPHASPVFHAIQYLLGNLDQRYLTTLRDFKGLQAYPSRTKDPDYVDFSMGSVGLGAIAPNFASLAEQYVHGRFTDTPEPTHRFVSTVGDAELDEGTVWEAVIEPALATSPRVLWVVDVNRQSLDRIIPGIRVQVWREMLAANGWRVIDAKYGSLLQEAFAAPKGELLREAIDSMPNETYQRLLREPDSVMREWLPRYSRFPQDLAKLIGEWDDDHLRRVYQNLGGHDFATLREAYAEADAADRPSIIFAYTFKGWRLPTVGDPQNHSVLLSNEQLEAFRESLAITETWPRPDPGSPEGRLCAEIGERSRSATKPRPVPELHVPDALGHAYPRSMSTQQAFGVMLVDLAREWPGVAEHMVTVSPDVASSTNLGGWINRVGVWNAEEGAETPEDTTQRALNWHEHAGGRHIQLGISESNLFMLLGQLGLSHELFDDLLLPIGTLYDPFIARALEALMYGTYVDSKFMVVGTPSGVSLSREGGAHQSIVTPPIGIGVPGLAYYEPCFAQELEWIVLEGLRLMATRESSVYLRLSTKRIDQGLLALPEDLAARERLRRQVIDGAHLLSAAGPAEDTVNIFTAGVMAEEAVKAQALLAEDSVAANVVNVTSPDRLFQRYQRASMRLTEGTDPGRFLSDVLPPEAARAPAVTVIDGHPQTLAWLGGALGTRCLPLGVSLYGQSGSQGALYSEYRIDAESIAAACLGALEGA